MCIQLRTGRLITVCDTEFKGIWGHPPRNMYMLDEMNYVDDFKAETHVKSYHYFLTYIQERTQHCPTNSPPFKTPQNSCHIYINQKYVPAPLKIRGKNDIPDYNYISLMTIYLCRIHIFLEDKSLHICETNNKYLHHSVMLSTF